MCLCRVLDAEPLLRSGGPQAFFRGHGPLLRIGFIAPSAQFGAYFHWVFDLPELVEQMVQRPPGMTPGHPRASVSHHFPGHLALRGLVTVDRAVCTGGLVLTVGALLQPLFSVAHQFRTFRTEFGACRIIVMVLAINARHAHQCVVFALQPAGKIAH